MPIEKVGVVGCGLMGSGIAQVCAQAGYQTVVREVSEALAEKGLRKIRRFLNKAVDRGKATQEDIDEALGRLVGTTALSDLADCDLVIEAVPEDMEIKRETYTSLDESCKESTIFASNTSSLSITEMAVMTDRPDRFIGLHFFSPVPLMKLLEVIYTRLTDQAVVEVGRSFGKAIGKTPVVAKDRTGFIVNRLLVPYMLEAIRVLEEGLASTEDIDNAMKLGCGYPMGPFTLLDFIGLDTTYYIANIMFDEFRTPQFAPPPLLKRMVLAGHHGRKSGRGFYEYGD